MLRISTQTGKYTFRVVATITRPPGISRVPLVRFPVASSRSRPCNSGHYAIPRPIDRPPASRSRSSLNPCWGPPRSRVDPPIRSDNPGPHRSELGPIPTRDSVHLSRKTRVVSCPADGLSFPWIAVGPHLCSGPFTNAEAASGFQGPWGWRGERSQSR